MEKREARAGVKSSKAETEALLFRNLHVLVKWLRIITERLLCKCAMRKLAYYYRVLSNTSAARLNL